MTAADDVHSAQLRLGNTIKSLGHLDNMLDNVLRYINHPQVTAKSARRKMLEAIGVLGHSLQGQQLALKTFHVDERFDLMALAIRNMRDEIEDLVVEIQDLKDRASRWEGDLRH